MTTGIASEAVIELRLVGLLADVCRIELANAVAQLGLSLETANQELGCVLQVWQASCEEIRSRLATHVLDTADEEEATGNGH